MSPSFHSAASDCPATVFRIGGQRANIEAFTDMQWITLQQQPGSYPF
jgi:hypothetical protein